MIDGKPVEVKPGEKPRIIFELLDEKPEQPKAAQAAKEVQKRKRLCADYLSRG